MNLPSLPGLLRTAAQVGAAAVEQVWGWNDFGFGPPTAESACTMTCATAVHWDQAGLSLKWTAHDGDETTRVEVCIGPLELSLETHGIVWPLLRRHTDDDYDCRTWSVIDESGHHHHQLHLFKVAGHLGVLAQWGAIRNQRTCWLLLGPVGVAVDIATSPPPPAATPAEATR